jgi:hypothetical protein
VRDIKEYIRAAQRTIPDDTTGNGDLVHKRVVEKDLKEIRTKSALLEQLGKYKHTDDLLKDFSLDAAKRTIIEMEHGKTSQDRLKAAGSVLDRSLGKPVERVANLNLDVTNMEEAELDSKIQDLMSQCGYAPEQRKLLLDEERERSAPKGTPEKEV